MQLSPSQIQQVRSSFALLEPMAAPAAALFYQRLFEAHPELRPMFRANVAEQGQKLMQMLAAAVALLDQPQTLTPILQRLGERHQGYRVQDWHYSAVGEALLATLTQCLGERFDTQQRQAWSQAYALISHTMQQPARHAVVC